MLAREREQPVVVIGQAVELARQGLDVPDLDEEPEAEPVGYACAECGTQDATNYVVTILDHDDIRQLVFLTLPTDEVWMFRAAGGAIGIEGSTYYDAAAAVPQKSLQVVVHAEVVGYLGQVTWSFSRLSEPAAR